MFVDIFLDDLSCRFFVTSIFCLLDVLSVDVLSVSRLLVDLYDQINGNVKFPKFAFCSISWPIYRYQVSVYRTIGPLVLLQYN